MIGNATSAALPGPAPVRVMIADDDVHVRSALIDLIGDEETLRCVGAAFDTASAVVIARTEQPDVAVLDVQMPGGGGVQAAYELHRLCPHTILIGLSANGDRPTRNAMLAAGVERFLVKGSPDTDLLATIAELVAERGRAAVAHS